MDPVIAFVVFMLGLAAFSLILSRAKSALHKRTGTGEWAEHGANPTKERVAEVERSRQLHRMALSKMLSGEPDVAQGLWEESAGMGHLPAHTALGILHLLEDRSWLTTRHWHLPAGAGDGVCCADR